MVKAEAYPFQRVGVRAIEGFDGRALVADEMGLGKTLQALWFIRRERVPTFPALVVCPASVKYNWEHEAREHVGLRAHVLEGRTLPEEGGLGAGAAVPRLTIINPDILTAWMPRLVKMGFQTMVLDECQMYANRGAKRTQAAMYLAQTTRNVLALSGTPLVNRPAELWPTLNMIRPDIFPSFWSYAVEHCKPRRRRWGWDYSGATNLGQLHETLVKTCMIRRLKTDVLKDLPDKVRAVVPMEIGRKGLAEYEYAKTSFADWLHKTHGATRANRAARAEAVTKIGYLLRLTARLKARAVVDWCNRFLAETDKKLAVFCTHTKMIELLQRRIKGKHTTVDGTVTGRRRQAAVNQFRRDPKTRTIIGNIRALGTGVNGLQDVCQDMAFAELWWRPGDHIQAEDRIHRIGQAGSAWINYLVAPETLEEDLCGLLQRKHGTIRTTLDGRPQTDDLDVLDMLISTLRAA